MKNKAETILKMIRDTNDGNADLNDYFNNLQNNEETIAPTIDDVVSSAFDYDDIMHYFKIETQDHKPMDIDSRKTHRMAKWCRMFLDQKY
jgi:hypothetical protein